MESLHAPNEPGNGIGYAFLVAPAVLPPVLCKYRKNPAARPCRRYNNKRNALHVSPGILPGASPKAERT